MFSLAELLVAVPRRRRGWRGSAFAPDTGVGAPVGDGAGRSGGDGGADRGDGGRGHLHVLLGRPGAHAHGAEWNGRKPGGFGDAGVYSFYATKTVSTGEGGVLVSSNADLIEFARKFRNYGKFEHEVDGLNFRMSEFTAALGIVQAERMEEIVAWKNDYAREHLDPAHPARLELPNTDWVAENHWCVPLYYRPESRDAALAGKGEGS